MRRQRLNLVLAVLAVSGAGAFGWLSLTASPTTVAVPAEAAALVVKPGVADLGQARQNQTLIGQYRIVNRLPVAVDIIQVAKSCSCADADPDTKHLEPGEATNLNVAWKTGLKRGRVSDRITVMAKTVEDKPQTVFAELILKADIIPDVLLEPESVTFTRGEAGVKSFVVKPSVLFDVKLVQAYGNVKGLKAVALPGVNTVEVTYTPTDVPADAQDPFVLVETTSTVEKWIRVPVRLIPSESK